MAHFALDLETLGKGTDSIILSIAIVYFELGEHISYEELLKRSLLVKFNVMEQKKMGRKINRDTLEWWSNQPKDAQKASLFPSKNDVTVEKGIRLLDEYVEKHGSKENMSWARGSLDQLLLDSLYTAINKKPSLKYNQYMDIRTFNRLMKESTDAFGYTSIPNFDMSKVVKHHPVHDIALDVMGILYGS